MSLTIPQSKISELPAASALALTDIVQIVKSLSASKKQNQRTTLDALKTFLADEFNMQSGSFVPSLVFQTMGDAVFTYSSQQGEYTRVGDLVMFAILFTFDVNAYTTASGQLRLSGLPFTNNAISNHSWTGYTSNITLPAGAVGLVGNIMNGQTTMNFKVSRSALSSVALDVSSVPAGTTSMILAGSGWYIAVD